MNGKYVHEGLKLNANTEYPGEFRFKWTLKRLSQRSSDRCCIYTRSGTVEGAGSFITGQDQDVIGGKFQSEQSFQGRLRNCMLWRRALKEEEVHKMYQNTCYYLFTSERKNIEIFGGVTAMWPQKC